MTQALLERGERVEIVTRDEGKADAWRRRGARAVVVDVHDTGALRRVFQGGKRLYLLNPPAPPSTDTAREERATLSSILSALEGSGLEKIVAQSTYAAQPGDRIGDLGVLYEMEQALAAQPIPSSILRGAYYMSNWEASLETVMAKRELPSFYPTDMVFPMVAPSNLGEVAARLMTEPLGSSRLVHVEGPERYSPNDVAAAFGAALKTVIRAVEIPRADRVAVLRSMGFSEPAAESFSAMTDAAMRAEIPAPEHAIRGTTSLATYVTQRVQVSH
ncbi:NmrA family transcriptional regulator [Pendulispora rubella]|uniref:NmrA family transcriptional regulator n=1 Tax=Pendulispora rubella TaxID=2741070 RepID=A0ABZ2LC71_9BACT